MSFHTILSFAAALFGGILAVLILYRDRRSFVHRTFAAGMIALALEAVLTGVSVQAQLPEAVIRWQRIRFVIEAFVPSIWLLFALSFTRENYGESFRRMKWLLVSCFAIPVILGMGLNGYLVREAVLSESSMWVVGLTGPGYLLQAFVLLMVVIVLMSFERTLRASSGHMRWQIKFMIVGLGSLFAVRVYTGSQTLLVGSVSMGLEVVNAGALIAAGALMVRSLLRLRVLSIDFYPSHAFLYSSFTVILVGAYFIAVGILAKLAAYFDGGQSLALRIFLVFLAFLGLSLFLLSDRFRHKIKRFVAVQMKRPQYDYREVWTKFTEKTSMITDVEKLCMTVARMVSETLEVLSVSVWLLDESRARLRPVGSTVFSETGAGHRISEEGKINLVQLMRNQERPIDLDDPKTLWAHELKQSMPGSYREARVRYCAPLLAGGNLLGVMTLGDRVKYEPLSFEEIDLLKTIADQTARNLLSLKLSEDLRKAKEIEAFQTMSSFFIHDLKNLASKLSMTVQNLPVYFDNPEFRRDASCAITESVGQINQMCSSLSLLKQQVILRPAPIDFNRIIASTIRSLNGCKVSIKEDLSPLPEFFADSEQIQKVIMNLILNSNEAIKNGGEIRVATEKREGWAILSVYDNGCGMSKEFVEKSLFRPFKSTKKQGMGIGLFQSKVIVEAHQGRIEVESEEGRGTTFRVMLPLRDGKG